MSLAAESRCASSVVLTIGGGGLKSTIRLVAAEFSAGGASLRLLASVSESSPVSFLFLYARILLYVGFGSVGGPPRLRDCTTWGGGSILPFEEVAKAEEEKAVVAR